MRFNPGISTPKNGAVLEILSAIGLTCSVSLIPSHSCPDPCNCKSLQNWGVLWTEFLFCVQKRTSSKSGKETVATLIKLSRALRPVHPRTNRVDELPHFNGNLCSTRAILFRVQSGHPFVFSNRGRSQQLCVVFPPHDLFVYELLPLISTRSGFMVVRVWRARHSDLFALIFMALCTEGYS